ncbi:hypothetical protein [Yokenella regensburgei]
MDHFRTVGNSNRELTMIKRWKHEGLRQYSKQAQLPELTRTR